MISCIYLVTQPKVQYAQINSEVHSKAMFKEKQFIDNADEAITFDYALSARQNTLYK